VAEVEITVICVARRTGHDPDDIVTRCVPGHNQGMCVQEGWMSRALHRNMHCDCTNGCALSQQQLSKQAYAMY
jgi:hypothetical protein